MAWLRVASMLVLALWMGGLAALAMSASTVFAALEARDPDQGRALAGYVVGALIERVQTWGWILGGALLAILALRAIMGPRPRRFAVRMWTIVLLLGISIAAAIYVTPRVAAIRDEAAGRVSAWPEDDPRRREFNRLHGLSNILVLVTLVAGVGLIYAEVNDSH
jgi:hypothetical protein